MRRACCFACGTALACLAPSSAVALTAEETNTIAAHERVARSTVFIVVRGSDEDDRGAAGGAVVTGSGFAIEPGLVVTNYHVVEDAAEISVSLQQGDRADAILVGTAPQFDLALLRVPFGPEILPPAALGSGADLQVGQKVLTVSTPLGLWHSLTVGVVSGLNREMPGLELGPSLIQFDAPLNPGQSGGPLVDSEGRVVAVTTAKIRGAEAIGLGIPVEVVRRILPDLKEMGHVFQPQLGFSGVSVDLNLSRLFDLPVPLGVLVAGIQPGSVADRAGLAVGHRHVFLRGRDYVLGGDIIVAVDGTPVQSAEDLMLRLLGARPGEKVAVSLVGPAGRREIALTIPEMKH